MDIEKMIFLLFVIYLIIGWKWSTIATHVPGRTEYQIERYWHTRNSMPTRNLMPSRNLMQGNRTFLFEDEHMNVVYEIGGDNINTISYTTHQTESESSYSVSFNSHGISSVSSKWSTTNHASSNYLTHATLSRDKNKSMDMEEGSGSFEASKISQV
ncbi:transcription factor MYB15-like [Mercurialis annua]|uniref:transcription factor MYB15-like n=1 Tax=Mercurialis annua TaxID=3986 RepID=UPI0021600C47|nr:transcription factor MYB15-like [Mercurialis annua]